MSSSSNNKLGQRIGEHQRYRLDKRLGSGAIGDVYLAMDIRLGRAVAIKLLKKRWSSHSELLARFQREIELMAALNSEHIIQILDYGLTEEGAHFYVMEYLQGRTLGQLMAQVGTMPLERALDIGIQICAGLKVAHTGVQLWNEDPSQCEHVKVVHRDLKPANIFLIHTGFRQLVKILDFGIAKKLHDDSGERTDLTQAFLGTFHYSPPEQLKTNKDLDERADIYSFGMILYEMLAGCDPFGILNSDRKQSEVAWATAHASQNPQPLLTQPGCEHLPRELAECVMRCLCKTPSSRFSSVTEIKQMLSVIAEFSSLETSTPAPNTPPPPKVVEDNTVLKPIKQAPAPKKVEPTIFKPIQTRYREEQEQNSQPQTNINTQPLESPAPTPNDFAARQTSPQLQDALELPSHNDITDGTSNSTPASTHNPSEPHRDISGSSVTDETIFQLNARETAESLNEPIESTSNSEKLQPQSPDVDFTHEDIKQNETPHETEQTIYQKNQSSLDFEDATHIPQSVQAKRPQELNHTIDPLSSGETEDGTIYQNKSSAQPLGDQTIFQPLSRSQAMPPPSNHIAPSPSTQQNREETIFQTTPRVGAAPNTAKRFHPNPAHSREPKRSSDYSARPMAEQIPPPKRLLQKPAAMGQLGTKVGRVRSFLISITSMLGIRLPRIFYFSPTSWLSRLRGHRLKYQQYNNVKFTSNKFTSNIFSVLAGLVIGLLFISIAFLILTRMRETRQKIFPWQNSLSSKIASLDQALPKAAEANSSRRHHSI